MKFGESESLLDEAEIANIDSENVILGSALVLVDSGGYLGTRPGRDWWHVKTT